ncbi:MAG: amidase [Hyphomicrobiales bacterium]
MNVTQYASYDATGLAGLVAGGEVSPTELAKAAADAIEKVNPVLNAVVETYPDRIDELDEATLGDGPFRGVPFLIKDVFGHEAGRRIDFGSRLCDGMVVDTSSYFVEGLEAAGVNILGRSHAPEFSMSATTETVLFGNCSNPWKQGYSAGGSSGGAQAAVTAGAVPIAHGSDIAGSIRIPASWCGGVGLKPSRGRVSVGPTVDEAGFGFAVNLVQARTVRDVAGILDCVSAPRPGDCFVIPRPDRSYTSLIETDAPRLRIGIVLDELSGAANDPEVAAAVEATGRALEDLGHSVEHAHADMGGIETLRAVVDLFFFAFDARIEGYARQTGRPVGPDTLEPVILNIYEHAKTITPARFMQVLGVLNGARRKLAAFWNDHDIWLSPTTAQVAEPWGRYHLSREGISVSDVSEVLFRAPTQYAFPHNLMGTPAMSLPLAMHSSGLPIGVQLAAGPAREHLLLQLAAALEKTMPWQDRVPPLHVSAL